MGPIGATALVVGNMIGVGVFLLPSTLAPFGWGSVLGWGITLVGALCLAWVFATLSRHLPNAGGASGILREALGSGPAFLAAWGYWISAWTANALLAIGGVRYLGNLVPVLERSPLHAAVTACAVLWGLVALNLRGVRAVGRVQSWSTVVKLLPFAAVLVVALLRLLSHGTGAIAPVNPQELSLDAATTAATLTLFSMMGVECAAMPAETVERPERTVPLATMLGTWLTGIAGLLVCSAVVLMMPSAQVEHSAAPIADFVARDWGTLAGALVTACAVVGAFGALNGWVLIVAEVPAALAKSGDLPSWWGERNAKGAARPAVLVSGVLTTGLVLANYARGLSSLFTFIILLSTATCLLLYLLAPIAAVILTQRGVVPRTRGLMLACAGAATFAIWAIVGAGAEAVAWGTALIALGWPLYRAMRRLAVAVTTQR